MSLLFHFLTDLLVVGPAFYILGAMFGLEWIGLHNHG